MANVQQVKQNLATLNARNQALLDLANATTGNTDTNLTDGVNALVEGYGQGGSDGIEGGYDVTFYDENNEGLAFYSIKEGHSINPPVYECDTWLDDDGNGIVFPYTPTKDIIIRAICAGYLKQIYGHYNVDSVLYPYLCIIVVSNNVNVVFASSYSAYTSYGKKYGRLSNGYCKTITGVTLSAEDKTDIGKVVSASLSSDTELSAISGTWEFTDPATFYTNFDISINGITFTSPVYRLDQ